MKTLFALLLSVLIFSAQGSALGDAVKLMSPHAFRPIINSTGLETGMFRVGLNNECIFPFANGAAWDPANEKILFIGAPHQHPWVYGFPIYDVQSNNWRSGNVNPYFNPVPTMQVNTHSYDNVASIYGTGKFYYFTPTPNTHPAYSTNAYSLNIYDVPTDTWDIEVVPNSMVSGPYSSITYFPDINSLIYANGGLISRYNLGTHQWNVLGNRTMGGIHNLGEYNPVHKIVVVGGGSDNCRQLYKIDTLLNITPIKAAPFNLEVTTCILTCDPVTGTYLALCSDSLYGYDVATDTWSSIVKAPVANFDAQWAVATPIKEYGVVAFLTNYSWPLLLYKHANSVVVEKNETTRSTHTLTVSASPNPVTGTAQIHCQLSEAGHGNLDILSLEGRIIRSMAMSGAAATVRWNRTDTQGSRVPAGVYLVRVRESSGKQITGKIILAD